MRGRSVDQRIKTDSEYFDEVIKAVEIIVKFIDEKIRTKYV